MTVKDRKARERVLYRKHAQMCANLFQTAFKVETIASNMADSPKYEPAREQAAAAWCVAGQMLWLFCACNPKNLSEALHAIAYAMEGKLHGKFYDDLLIKAFKHADHKGRKGHKGFHVGHKPTPKQIDTALTILSGRNSRPTKRGAIRRLEILGYLPTKIATARTYRNRGNE